MARRENAFKQKAKIEKKETALAEEMEEIVVKLGAVEAGEKQILADLKDAPNGGHREEKLSITDAPPLAALADSISIPQTVSRADGHLPSPKIAVASAMRKLRELPLRKLDIQAVEVFQPFRTPLPTQALTANEECSVRAIFRISGTEALALTREKAAFQLACYVNNLTAAGAAPMLGKSEGQLIEDKLDYTIHVRFCNLAAGLYRLTTVVVILTSPRMTASYQGPIFRVS